MYIRKKTRVTPSEALSAGQVNKLVSLKNILVEQKWVRQLMLVTNKLFDMRPGLDRKTHMYIIPLNREGIMS